MRTECRRRPDLIGTWAGGRRQSRSLRDRGLRGAGGRRGLRGTPLRRRAAGRWCCVSVPRGRRRGSRLVRDEQRDWHGRLARRSTFSRASSVRRNQMIGATGAVGGSCISREALRHFAYRGAGADIRQGVDNVLATLWMTGGIPVQMRIGAAFAVDHRFAHATCTYANATAAVFGIGLLSSRTAYARRSYLICSAADATRYWD